MVGREELGGGLRGEVGIYEVGVAADPVEGLIGIEPCKGGLDERLLGVRGGQGRYA